MAAVTMTTASAAVSMSMMTMMSVVSMVTVAMAASVTMSAFKDWFGFSLSLGNRGSIGVDGTEKKSQEDSLHVS